MRVSPVTVEKAYDRVRTLACEASVFGYRRLENGTELFGHVPHVAPEAWLHELFAPLVDDELAKLELSLGRPLPDDYAEWLRLCNGGHFFSMALSFDGLRRTNSRDPEAREPFALETPNLYERPDDAPEDALFFGFYRADGSHLYLGGDGKVYRCARDSAKPLNDWDDFAAAVISELERLRDLFDQEGRPKDPDWPTSP